MAGYDLLLFDLDGTLTDPQVGITRSVQYALARFGLSAAAEELIPFIGPPLLDSFKRFFHLDDVQARRAIDYYREYYGARGIYENTVYPEIEALLAELQTRGKTLAVATAKPTFYASKILRHFHLERYFDLVAGNNMDETMTRKGEIIAGILRDRPAFAPERTVMIGDHSGDIAGARENGIASVGVAYGFGDTAELRRAGPTCLVYTVEELGKLLTAGDPAGRFRAGGK